MSVIARGEVPAANNRRRRSLAFRRRATPYLFVAPAVFIVSLVLVYPVVSGIVTSMRDVNLFRGLDEGPFIGLQNYAELFGDPKFINSLTRTFFIVGGSVVVGIVLSLVTALTLHSLPGFQRFFRSTTLIPFFVSGVAVGVSWRFLFNTDSGVPNTILGILGFAPVSWLGDEFRAMIVVILANTWAIAPLAILIILGGLQTVDPQMKEAARVDGAGGLAVLRHITLPSISPQIGLSLVWLSFASFSVFSMIMPMTGGGPLRATEVLAIFMYNEAFKAFNFGTGAAVMVVMLLITTLVSVVFLRIFGRESLLGNAR